MSGNTKSNFEIKVRELNVSLTLFRTYKKKAVERAIHEAPAGCTFTVREFRGGDVFRAPFEQIARLHKSVDVAKIMELRA